MQKQQTTFQTYTWTVTALTVVAWGLEGMGAIMVLLFPFISDTNSLNELLRLSVECASLWLAVQACSRVYMDIMFSQVRGDIAKAHKVEEKEVVFASFQTWSFKIGKAYLFYIAVPCLMYWISTM